MAEQNGNGTVTGLEPRYFVGDFGPRELVSLGKAASPQTRAGVYPADIGAELGRSGLRHWGGFVFEEWLNQLQRGQQAAQVYRDMMDSDPIVGAIMYAIQSLIRRVTTKVQLGDYGSTVKMLVRLDDNNKVWGTVPLALDCPDGGYRGHRVEFTGTIERSRDDEHFGFFSRPTKASLVEEVAA